MKIYEGSRTMDGLLVTVDGAPLSDHCKVKQFTKRGFEWTYEGTSPQQLRRSATSATFISSRSRTIGS